MPITPKWLPNLHILWGPLRDAKLFLKKFIAPIVILRELIVETFYILFKPYPTTKQVISLRCEITVSRDGDLL